MIRLYTAATPNGRKASIALEELGLSYEVIRVDIQAPEHPTPEFLDVTPNHKIPVLDDDGLPINPAGDAFVDFGLGEILAGSPNDEWRALATENDGKHKVPTVRNVDKRTGRGFPKAYMHNGVFQKLETAIVFYNQFLVVNDDSKTNPETGHAWRAAEVPQTVDLGLLRLGQPMTKRQVELLVAFLESLTDRQFEHLLER